MEAICLGLSNTKRLRKEARAVTVSQEDGGWVQVTLWTVSHPCGSNLSARAAEQHRQC